MKLTFRFVLLVLVLVASVGASAAAGWRALGRLDLALQGVVESDMERVLSITHTRRLFRSMVVLERDYILSTSSPERAGMAKKMDKLGGELDQQIDKYQKLMPSEDVAAVGQIRVAKQRWLALHTEVQKAREAGQEQALTVAKAHAADPVSWEKVIGALVTLSEKRLAKQVSETHAVYARARLTLAWVSGGALLIAAALGTAIFLGIRRNLQEVVELNTNLEGLVKVRTEALANRERALRLVLDSTGDGIFGIRQDGALVGEASAAAQTWFGPAEPGESASNYLYPDDADGQLSFRIAFDQLLEDLLPWEVCVDQMPRRIQRGESVLDLEYRQVSGDAQGARVLVIARDVTAKIQSEQNEENIREQQKLISRLLEDKVGFAQFVKDSEALLQSLCSARDASTVRRDLHTLKGNVAVYGLTSVAHVCHRLESSLEDTGGIPRATDSLALATLFSRKLENIGEFLNKLGSDVLEVEGADHSALIESLRDRRDYKEILKLVEVWSWHRASELLMRLRTQAEYVAKRLDKPISVEVEHGDVRVPPDYLEKFWPTLVHVIRNAVDHGIEPSEERERRGKRAAATLALRIYQTEDTFVLEIADDGPGIDREALLHAAELRGLPIASDATLADLVFMEGLSSREQVSELSGRGVGMSAVLAACRDEGGELEVKTERGQGTCFQFRFRRPIVRTGVLAARLERRWSLAPSVPNSATMPTSNARKLAGQ